MGRTNACLVTWLTVQKGLKQSRSSSRHPEKSIVDSELSSPYQHSRFEFVCTFSNNLQMSVVNDTYFL